MNVEIGTEAAQFPEKEYINGIFFAVRNGKMDQFAVDLPVVAWQRPGVGGVGGAAGEVSVAQAAALTPLQDVVQAPRHPAIFIIILKGQPSKTGSPLGEALISTWTAVGLLIFNLSLCVNHNVV